MENTLPIFDNLIPMDMLLARLTRDKINGVRLVQGLTKHFGRRGEYYTRVVATENNGQYYTYRANSQGKVAKSWVALNASSIIVEKEVGSV